MGREGPRSKAAECHSLSATFRSLLDSLSGEWGFITIRTAYAEDETADKKQWSTALATLRAYSLRKCTSEDMAPDDVALPVISDRSALDGVSYDSVRTAFHAWIEDYDRYKDQRADDEQESGFNIRRDCVLVVDETALASLLQAPEESQMVDRSKEPFVVVVDTTDPASVSHNGGGPYQGWMRAHVRSLADLFDDLDCLNMGEELCPTRKYEGQIALYNGSTQGSLIDPPGGLEGRYKFPSGTPRGFQAAQAMRDEIRRATGA